VYALVHHVAIGTEREHHPDGPNGQPLVGVETGTLHQGVEVLRGQGAKPPAGRLDLGLSHTSPLGLGFNPGGLPGSQKPFACSRRRFRRCISRPSQQHGTPYRADYKTVTGPSPTSRPRYLATDPTPRVA